MTHPLSSPPARACCARSATQAGTGAGTGAAQPRCSAHIPRQTCCVPLMGIWSGAGQWGAYSAWAEHCPASLHVTHPDSCLLTATGCPCVPAHANGLHPLPPGLPARSACLPVCCHGDQKCGDRRGWSLTPQQGCLPRRVGSPTSCSSPVTPGPRQGTLRGAPAPGSVLGGLHLLSCQDRSCVPGSSCGEWGQRHPPSTCPDRASPRLCTDRQTHLSNDNLSFLPGGGTVPAGTA